MKKIISYLLTSGIFALSTIPSKADTVYVLSSPSSTPASIFSVSDDNGTITWTDLTDIPGSYVGSQYNFFDPATNKIYSQNWSTDQYSIYDIDSDTWTTGNNIGATSFDAYIIPSISQSSNITANTSNISTLQSLISSGSGTNSVKVGPNPTAAGNASSAFGYNATASGDNSIRIWDVAGETQSFVEDKFKL